MTAKTHPLYAGRLWKMGTSVVFPIYKSVMAALGAKEGSLVLVRVHPPYATFRVIPPNEAVDLKNMDLSELPPSQIPKGTPVQGDL